MTVSTPNSWVLTWWWLWGLCTGLVYSVIDFLFGHVWVPKRFKSPAPLREDPSLPPEARVEAGVVRPVAPMSKSGAISLRSADPVPSRGVVYAAGGRYLKQAVLSVRSLRYHGYEGSVTFVGGDASERPSAEECATLAELGVRWLDVHVELKRMGWDCSGLNLCGYQLKPFAMLVSGYVHAVLLDADSVCFDNVPALLWSSREYQKYGTVFFPDLVSCHVSYTLNPKVWSYLGLEPMNADPWQQDSSVVAMNLGTHLRALWDICRLNADYENLYRLIHGDKDTWRMGCARVGLPYFMVSRRAASLAYPLSRTDRTHMQYAPGASADAAPIVCQGGSIKQVTRRIDPERQMYVRGSDWGYPQFKGDVAGRFLQNRHEAVPITPEMKETFRYLQTFDERKNSEWVDDK